MKGRLTASSSSNDVQEFFSDLAITDDPFLNQADKRRSGRLPEFLKSNNRSHVAYKEVRYHGILPNLIRRSPTTKLCLIVRHPCAVIHSWLQAPREFRADLEWTASEEWRYALKKNLNRSEEYNGYERWKEATLLFHDLASRHPKSVSLVYYHDLVANTYAETKKLFTHCGINLDIQTKQFLDQSTSSENDDAYSVYRKSKRDDQWRAGLDASIVDAIKLDVQASSLAPFFEF